MVPAETRDAVRAIQLLTGLGARCRVHRPARIFEEGAKTCVRAGCYENVLVIGEFNPDEPDSLQLESYAPGVGNVRVGWAGALEVTQETLELTKVIQLDADALSMVRAAALALEKHA